MPSKKTSKKVAPKKAVKKAARFTKAAAKQTVKQAKQIGKTFKALKKAVKKVHPKKAAKKAAKKKAKKTFKKSYRIVEIPELQGKTWSEIMATVESEPEKIDALKRPNEKFVGSVFGNQTRVVYENATKLFAKLDQYVEEYKTDKDVLISSLKLLRFGGNPSKYAEETRSRDERRKAEFMEMREEAGELLGKTDEQGKRRNNTSFLREALATIKKDKAEKAASEKRIAKLEANQAKLMQMLEKLTSKPTKKKAAKKSTKKVSKNETKRSSKPSTKGATKGAKKRPTVKRGGKTVARGASKKAVSKSKTNRGTGKNVSRSKPSKKVAKKATRKKR